MTCGANINFDAVTSATADLKSKLTSQLGGNFTSASALKDAVSANITSVSSNLSSMLPEIPSVPAISFQGELTALAGIDLSTPAGLLEYQSKLSSITNNFGSALSSGSFDLDDLVSKAAPTISSLSGSASGALSQITDAASGASSLVTDAISEASSVASSLGSVVSGVSASSFDICKDCPNFELQAGATEALQSAQETVLSNAKGIAEEFAEVSTNVDFNAQFSEMTTKANKILADPDVQAQISSDISSAQTQISADIESGIDLLPDNLSVTIPKFSPFK